MENVISFVDENGITYFRGKDIAKLLGYKDTDNAVRKHVCYTYKVRLSELSTTQPMNSKHPQTLFITESGVRQLIAKSRMPNSCDIARLLNIDVTKTKVLTKEQDSINCIMKAFKGENMIFQSTVGKYRIDLYFPKYKLAIECDEHGHNDRDLQKELKRQKYLEDKLNCHFIRYNPDSSTYDIFDVINQIYQHLKK